MRAPEIHQALTRHLIPAAVIRILDTDYSLASFSWITGEFKDAFELLKKNLSLTDWIPDRMDCDDFSNMAQWYIGLLHKNNPQEIKTGIAFGTFTYKKDASEIHMINLAVVESGKVVFFEPQDSKIVSLSESEVLSCTEARL